MSSSYPQVPARPADLNTYARIRNAALEGFAANGVASTSIRDVAAAAGVSPGLVQHHFGTKAGLRDAVNDFVVAGALDTFRDLVRDGGSAAAQAAALPPSRTRSRKVSSATATTNSFTASRSPALVPK